jgi:sulfite reductase (ferredoxin)
VNTHHGVISDFDKHFVQTGDLKLKTTFKDLILQINQNEPTKQFAELYYIEAKEFLQTVKSIREKNLV